MTNIGSTHYRKGTRSWVCKVDGKSVPLLKGEKDEATFALAEAERQKLIIKHDLISQEDKSKLPLKQVFELYFEDNTPKIPTQNWKVKRKRLEQFSEKYGHKPISEISYLDIDDWIQSHDTWGNSARRKVRNELNSVFNSNTVVRIHGNNPCKTSRKYSDGIRGEDIAIQPETVKRLLEVARPAERELLTVLWQTGARPSEILTATASEYHSEKRWIDKSHWKTQGKTKHRCIMVKAESRVILDRLSQIHPTGPLFLNHQGRPWSVGWLRLRLRTLATKAGISEKVVPYGFRHGAACNWLRSGIPIETVSAWLGHGDVSITQTHYAKLHYLLGGSISRLDALPDAALVG